MLQGYLVDFPKVLETISGVCVHACVLGAATRDDRSQGPLEEQNQQEDCLLKGVAWVGYIMWVVQ